MSIINKRSTWFVAGALWGAVAGAPAFADDTEIFFLDPSEIVNQPNILIILDNSGSMLSKVETQGAFNPAVTYADTGCGLNRVYWSTASNPPVPSCSGNDNWFNRSALVCNAAIQAFNAGVGRYGRNRMAQYRDSSTTSNRDWLLLSSSQKSRIVECQADRGIHSDGSNSKLYARNDNLSPWGDANQEIGWSSMTNATVFDSNYMNWYYGPTGPEPKIDVVKDVANNLLSSLNGVNVGLMQFNYNEGGNVRHPVEDIANARTVLQDKITAIIPEQVIDGQLVSRFTPLSETMYEAALYWMGGKVDYGNVGPLTSVPESRIAGGDAYESPLELGCQKNFIIYLTDGMPTEDTSADDEIAGLPGFGTIVGGGCDGSGSGRCLDDLAEYMYEADLSALEGDQNVITYTIGFDIDLPILEETARRGGGAYFTATDAASLSTAFANIVESILDTSTTFTAPAVSINSFNRTRNLNDLFISVFSASGDAHWPGNLKKYRLRASDGEILDANGDPAVNPTTGFFAQNSQSYWSPEPDGPSVISGGAANRLPDPAVRNVYTYLGSAQLTDVNNRIATTNLLITNELLGTVQAELPARDEVIQFTRGMNRAGTAPRYQMGDPLHSQPATVIYGPDVTDAVVYFATNDGYLHAIDPNTGVEKWTFLPPEFLADQIELFINASTETKHYGIDGHLRLQVLADGDGTIETGEKVYLFFGMRRGGDFYYALDVTDPDQPTVMWRRGADELPGIGQSWSNAVPAKIDVPGVNDEKLVIVVGGGYDTSQDEFNGSVDSTGNAIFILDSLDGDVLWHGSAIAGDKLFPDMQYSIPGDIKVVDMNTDGYADRMYAADMGGQVWRFDIFNGETTSELVTGGVIAELAGPLISDTRRFYYSPDVALVTSDEQSFIHVGIGSGHRARPNSVFNQDRFYALRDYHTFNSLSQTDYDNMTPITDADLEDITDDIDAVVPAGSAGWKFELRDGGWIGEKVLAEARTFNNQVFFTTFTPGAGSGTNCEPVLGINRLYVMSLFNGAPVNNMDGSADEENLTEEDRYREFTGSIASEVVFIFPSPDDPNCVGEACTPPPVACVDLFCFPPGFGNDPVRTFWRQENVD